MPEPLFNPELTDERLQRALQVYAVTGPGWFIAALITELRLLRRAWREQNEASDATGR